MLTKEQIITDFSSALSNRRGAFFIGSGISKDSGLPGWDDLLQQYDSNIYNVTIREKIPLPMVAQYMVTEACGNGFALKHFVSTACSKYSKGNKYLRLIARTAVDRIWTTNYDEIIESEIGYDKCTVNVGDENIDKGADVNTIEIIKMHGSRRDIKSIILTQDDYDFYQLNNPNTCRRLLSDMSERVFLFIGYGYRDPNIHNILRTSQWKDRTPVKRHYLITLRDKKSSELQDLWAKNLLCYGIYVFFIDTYDDLYKILQEVSLKSRGKRIYVTGSHEDFDDSYCTAVAELIAKYDNLILMDGQSAGVSSKIVEVFSRECILKKKDRIERLESYHNPYAVNPKFANDSSLLSDLKLFREPLLKRTQIVVLFDGGMGTKAEFDVAVDMGCLIIPVPVAKFSGDYSDFMNKEILSSEYVKDCLSMFPDYYDKIKSKNATSSDLMTCLEKAISNC